MIRRSIVYLTAMSTVFLSTTISAALALADTTITDKGASCVVAKDGVLAWSQNEEVGINRLAQLEGSEIKGVLPYSTGEYCLSLGSGRRGTTEAIYSPCSDLEGADALPVRCKPKVWNFTTERSRALPRLPKGASPELISRGSIVFSRLTSSKQGTAYYLKRAGSAPQRLPIPTSWNYVLLGAQGDRSLVLLRKLQLDSPNPYGGGEGSSIWAVGLRNGKRCKVDEAFKKPYNAGNEVSTYHS